MATLKTFSKLIVSGNIAAAALVVESKSNISKKQSECCCHDKKELKANQLSLYETDDDITGYEVIERPPSSLQQKISFGHKTLAAYIDSVQHVTDKVESKYQTAVAHTKTSYEYITDEDNAMARAAAITFGGLSGLLFGIRGGILKKAIYSGTGMTLVASLCYPKQAAEYSKNGYTWVKDKTVVTVKEISGYDLREISSDVSKKLPSTPSFDKIGEQVSDVQYYGFRLIEHDGNNSLVRNVFKSKKVEGDVGQSHPDDKDLYTTRGK